MVTPDRSLRLVFFGTPDFAVPTLRYLVQSRHPVVAVVTQPDRPSGRGQVPRSGPVKNLVLAERLPILQPERLRDEAFIGALRGLQPDLGVVVAYGKILTEAVLALPRLGLINVHASLLPKYRGAAPVHRAVMAGERETGVTIMRVVKALDAGPMLAKVRRPIGPAETSVEVEQGLAELGARALVDVVEALAAGPLSGTPQDEAEATYARKLEKEDGHVDWTRPALEIHNQVRGLHPWPHAYSDLNGERTILLESEVRDDVVEGRTPGAIVQAEGDVLCVQTGQGVLKLTRLQREGRRPLTAREFLAGRRLEPGSRFTRASPVP